VTVLAVEPLAGEDLGGDPIEHQFQTLITL
jgi:hypothetical protein